MSLNCPIPGFDLVINQIMHLAYTGQLTWRLVETPKPDVGRSFECVAGTLHVLVVQANTVEYGVICEGVLFDLANGILVSLSRNDPLKRADRLCHLAAASQN